ncbi:MAG: thioredoxin family protein [bacterium]
MKHLLGSLLLLCSMSYSSVFAEDKHSEIQVERVVDFQQLATQMKQNNLGLLLEFDADHCTYCVKLENEILRPMLLSGDYNDRILIKKLGTDDTTTIIGFDGKKTTGEEFAKKLGVNFTPTLVFLDSKGNELTERMLGINTPDMYGAYVDAAIEATESALLKEQKQVNNVLDLLPETAEKLSVQ